MLSLFNNESDSDEEEHYCWMEGDSLAPPCQSEQFVINLFLEKLNLSPGVTFCDLGCGDGRICLQASMDYGCRSIGIEIEDILVQKFNEKMEEQESHIQSLVQVIHGDIQEMDLDSLNIDVLFMYLLPQALVAIEDQVWGWLRGEEGRVCVSVGWKFPNIPFHSSSSLSDPHNPSKTETAYFYSHSKELEEEKGGGEGSEVI